MVVLKQVRLWPPWITKCSLAGAGAVDKAEDYIHNVNTHSFDVFGANLLPWESRELRGRSLVQLHPVLVQ